MKIIERMLTINKFTRPETRLGECKAVILHNGGIPGQRAGAIYDYFEHDCPAKMHYSSAHYGIDLDGTIYRWVPDNEVAYHCGSSQPDPASGKVYTDWARDVFGRYALDYKNNSPNNASIGIEMCIKDAAGNFDNRTLEAAAELVSWLCIKQRIPPANIGTHNMTVGWKECPLLWSREPVLFENFKNFSVIPYLT